MMVIKNSCVPVSFPANTQEKKYPISFKKDPCQTIIQHTMLKFALLDFYFSIRSGAGMLCLFGKPMLNDSGTWTERHVCL